MSTDLQTIKQALVDTGPLAVSMGYGSSYGGGWDGDIYRCTLDTGTNHAVVIVGYDDAGGYWWVRNSWGTGWGDNGYFKLGYGECYIERYVYYADAGPSDVGPLEYHSHTIDDDNSGNSNGNDDGVVDCGETIELYVDLLNQGTDGATGVDATISTTDPYVTWLHNTSSSYPDIAGSGTGTNSDDYDFALDPSTPSGHLIHFDLDITASNGGPWTDSFEVPVSCTSNNPPNTPNSPSPADGATGVSTTTDLSWTGGDPDSGDTVTYDVYFGTSDPPTTLFCNDVSSTTCDPGSLSYDTHYYWYVVATDNHAASTSGPIWDFTTAAGGDAYEPDNTWDQANWIYDGSPQTHSIVPVGDVDWTKFSLSAESEVVIETSGPSGDTRMWLYDSSLNELEYNDDGGSNLFSRIDRLCGTDALPAGTYYVKIDEYGNDGEILSYDITFTLVQTCPDVGPLTYDSHLIDDDTIGDSNGNGDGIVDCGESIELYVDLLNEGTDAATGVNTTVSTSDPYVLWLFNTSSTYPDIAGSGTGTNSDDYDLSVDPSTPNGHVIHFDLDTTASNGGPWTDSFEVPVICTPNNPPNTPSSPSPADGATGVSTTTDLSWTGGDPDSGDTVTYDAYFGTSDPPTALLCNDVSSTTCDPGTLSYDTHYYWYVVATDNHAASTSGSVWDFTTGPEPNNPPNTPSSPSPADGATGESTTTDLSWTGGDPDSGDTVTYDAYFGTSDPPTTLLCNDATSTTCDPGTLSYGTHYYWYVVATDNHAASTSGPVWDFTTGPEPNNPPNTPSSPSPVDGAMGVSTTADLSWTGGDPDSGDTVTYNVYFGTSNPPTTLLCNNVSSATCDPGSLSYNTPYYWYVVATDNHGASTSGPVWDFITTAGADAYEPDNTSDRANWIDDGSPQTHSIAPGGDVDWVKFSLSEESEVVIETSGPGGNTRMWLYDSGLNELEYNDDGENDRFSRIDRLCGTDALPTGTYYVKIDEYGNDDEIPSYDITFTVLQTCGDDFLIYLPAVQKNYR